MLNLLNSAQERFVGFGEASLYAVLGYAVVFVGIAFLIFIVWLVGKFLANDTQNEKSDNKKQTIQKAESTNEKAVPSVNTVVNEAETVDEETVAVIMAALMAYYEKNNPKCEFTVKRIKRI